MADDVHLHSLRHFQATTLDVVIPERQKRAPPGRSTVHMARHHTITVESGDRRAARHVGTILDHASKERPGRLGPCDTGGVRAFASLTLAVLAVISIGVGVLSTLDPSRRPAASPRLARCTIGQLRFTNFGGSGAAGTAVTGFLVKDASSTACVLQGRPKVQFDSGPVDAPRTLPVVVSHGGPGIAFSTHPGPVLLRRASAAGLLFTSADFGSRGGVNCPRVSLIVVRLPGSSRGIRVPLWYPSNACSDSAGQSLVSVSAFFPADSLGSYVTPTFVPFCRAGELAIGPGHSGVGLGHSGGTVVFRNIGTSACRLRGYPGVLGLDAAGRPVTRARHILGGYIGGILGRAEAPPLVTLYPGQVASAVVEGTDVPVGAATSCPVYSAILVAAPQSAHFVRVPIGIGGCSGLEVHPVVAGPTGSTTG